MHSSLRFESALMAAPRRAHKAQWRERPTVDVSRSVTAVAASPQNALATGRLQNEDLLFANLNGSQCSHKSI